MEPRPKAKMPGWREWGLFRGPAIIFDALKFIFAWFIFIGPAIAGVATTAAVSAKYGKVAGAVAGALVGVGTGYTLPEVYELIGILLGMCVSIIGLLYFAFMIPISRINLFGSNGVRYMRFLYGALASLIPLVNIFPTFTPSIWSITKHVRKEDREALKKWEKTNAEQASQQRQSQFDRAQQIRDAQEQEYAQPQVA